MFDQGTLWKTETKKIINAIDNYFLESTISLFKRAANNITRLAEIKNIMKSIYYILISCLLLFSCEKKTVPVITNTLESHQYILIKDDLLFKDNINNIYLRVNEVFPGTDSLYSSYYDYLTKDGHYFALKDIIDIDSFHQIDNTQYFKDKRAVYAYQQFPPRFDPITIIEINPEKFELLPDNYIKDDKNVYWLTKKLDADAKQFHVIKVGNMILGVDNNHLFWSQGDIMEYKDFEPLKNILNATKFEKLKQQYFPEEN